MPQISSQENMHYPNYLFPCIASIQQQSKTHIKILKKNPDRKNTSCRFVGLHQFTNPVLMIRDPELIKKITVKDFDSFMNHRVVISEDNEPIFGKNLLSLKGISCP